MSMKRGRMSAVPSMAVAPEPPPDTGSFGRVEDGRGSLGPVANTPFLIPV